MVIQFTLIENDGNFIIFLKNMLSYIFPFLYIREIFGSEFSGISFLIFNSHVIIALYIIFILLFRKVLIYSYRLFYFNLLIGIILAIYFFIKIKVYSSWYEAGGLWMMVFGISWICLIVSFITFLSDLLWISERKVNFRFWKFEKYLVIWLWIVLVYMCTALALYLIG